MSDRMTTPGKTRAWKKSLLMLLRRGHLYLGLFLLPWACLYGVTAFLFNHPTAFSDVPLAEFDAKTITSITFQPVHAAPFVAEQVMQQLNQRMQPTVPYVLDTKTPAKWNREFAFAQVKGAERQYSLLIDPLTGCGTVREQPLPVQEKKGPVAPFAIQGMASKTREEPKNTGPIAEPLWVEPRFAPHLEAMVPEILRHTGFFPEGKVTITSVPECVFTLQSDEEFWRVTYNPMHGSVSAKLMDDQQSGEPLSIRRFLLRLHLTHGYPNTDNAKFYWAIIVDIMAGVMVFWGVSGLFMWWQIKRTRWLGTIVVLISIVCATLLTLGMHQLLTAG